MWGHSVYAALTPVISDLNLKIVHLETMNLVVAFRLGGKFWRHSSIHMYCDNEAVVQVVASHKTRYIFLAACICTFGCLKQFLPLTCTCFTSGVSIIIRQICYPDYTLSRW